MKKLALVPILLVAAGVVFLLWYRLETSDIPFDAALWRESADDWRKGDRWVRWRMRKDIPRALAGKTQAQAAELLGSEGRSPEDLLEYPIHGPMFFEFGRWLRVYFENGVVSEVTIYDGEGTERQIPAAN